MNKSIIFICILVSMSIVNLFFLMFGMCELEQQTRRSWLFEYIIIIIMIIPSFLHLWRLMHVCKSTNTILSVCFTNLLIIQGLLYAGLGIATWPQNIIYEDLTGNFFDLSFLFLSIGVSRVLQFPGINSMDFPTTQLTVAFFIGSIVTAMTSGFAISYIASWVFVLKDNRNQQAE